MILVNVSGCFVIGFFGSLTGPDGRLVVGTTTRQSVMVGLCGGYTTFSSFSVQTLYLARDGEWLRAANIFLSLAFCFLAVWLGHIAAGATGDAADAIVAYEQSLARRREAAQDKAGAPARSEPPTGLDNRAAAGAGQAARARIMRPAATSLQTNPAPRPGAIRRSPSARLATRAAGE